jgi:hypothetical protein
MELSEPIMEVVLAQTEIRSHYIEYLCQESTYHLTMMDNTLRNLQRLMQKISDGGVIVQR